MNSSPQTFEMLWSKDFFLEKNHIQMHSTVRPQAQSLSHPPIPQRLSWGEFRGLVRDLILFVPIQTDPDCLGMHPRYKDNYLFKERKIASSLHPGLQSQPYIWSSWRSTVKRADFYFQLSCFTEYWPWALRHLTLYRSIPIYHRVFDPARWDTACENFLPYSKFCIHGRN